MTAKICKTVWKKTPGVRRYLSRAVAAWMLEGKVPLALMSHDCNRSKDCRVCRHNARRREQWLAMLQRKH